MNLNKLPVLVRTEVTAAAKGASLPAVYSRALAALDEAVSELSFAKLKTVEISVEGLAAWAKAHQDSKLSETARELKFRARRTANYIAEQLVKQRNKGSRMDVLKEAGYSKTESLYIHASARVEDTHQNAHLSGEKLMRIKTGKRTSSMSDVYTAAFGYNTPLSRVEWFRQNSARGIARRLTTDKEIAKAKQSVTLMRAWCEEFLKNLPRTVSKGKTS
jgi:hypothetical protein